LSSRKYNMFQKNNVTPLRRCLLPPTALYINLPTMEHPASIETSGFMINVRLQTLKVKPRSGFAGPRGDQRAPRAARRRKAAPKRAKGNKALPVRWLSEAAGFRSSVARQRAPAPRVSAGPAAQNPGRVFREWRNRNFKSFVVNGRKILRRRQRNSIPPPAP